LTLQVHNAIDFVMPDPEDQAVWNASLGLDLADRTVLEAEVLVWRIVRQRAAGSEESISRMDEKTDREKI
jgi:hypothetical protein